LKLIETDANLEGVKAEAVDQLLSAANLASSRQELQREVEEAVWKTALQKSEEGKRLDHAQVTAPPEDERDSGEKPPGRTSNANGGAGEDADGHKATATESVPNLRLLAISAVLALLLALAVGTGSYLVAGVQAEQRLAPTITALVLAPQSTQTALAIRTASALGTAHAQSTATSIAEKTSQAGETQTAQAYAAATSTAQAAEQAKIKQDEQATQTAVKQSEQAIQTAQAKVLNINEGQFSPLPLFDIPKVITMTGIPEADISVLVRGPINGTVDSASDTAIGLSKVDPSGVWTWQRPEENPPLATGSYQLVARSDGGNAATEPVSRIIAFDVRQPVTETIKAGSLYYFTNTDEATKSDDNALAAATIELLGRKSVGTGTPVNWYLARQEKSRRELWFKEEQFEKALTPEDQARIPVVP
jgi:hypothetical protein